MATQNMRTPKDVSREVSTKLGRKVDAKRVRQWVRDNVAAFDDDGYTAHLYNAETYRRIVAGLTGATKTQRSRAAAQGRSGQVKGASKPKTRTMGSGPVTSVPAGLVTAEGQGAAS